MAISIAWLAVHEESRRVRARSSADRAPGLRSPRTRADSAASPLVPSIGEARSSSTRGNACAFVRTRSAPPRLKNPSELAKRAAVAAVEGKVLQQVERDHQIERAVCKGNVQCGCPLHRQICEAGGLRWLRGDVDTGRRPSGMCRKPRHRLTRSAARVEHRPAGGQLRFVEEAIEQSRACPHSTTNGSPNRASARSTLA